MKGGLRRDAITFLKVCRYYRRCTLSPHYTSRGDTRRDNITPLTTQKIFVQLFSRALILILEHVARPVAVAVAIVCWIYYFRRLTSSNEMGVLDLGSTDEILAVVQKSNVSIHRYQKRRTTRRFLWRWGAVILSYFLPQTLFAAKISFAAVWILVLASIQPMAHRGWKCLRECLRDTENGLRHWKQLAKPTKSCDTESGPKWAYFGSSRSVMYFHLLQSSATDKGNKFSGLQRPNWLFKICLPKPNMKI